jgi:hypothetical protein
LGKRVIAAQQEPNLSFDVVLDAPDLDSVVVKKSVSCSRVTIKTTGSLLVHSRD